MESERSSKNRSRAGAAFALLRLRRDQPVSLLDMLVRIIIADLVRNYSHPTLHSNIRRTVESPRPALDEGFLLARLCWNPYSDPAISVMII